MAAARKSLAPFAVKALRAVALGRRPLLRGRIGASSAMRAALVRNPVPPFLSFFLLASLTWSKDEVEKGVDADRGDEADDDEVDESGERRVEGEAEGTEYEKQTVSKLLPSLNDESDGRAGGETEGVVVNGRQGNSVNEKAPSGAGENAPFQTLA